MSFTIIGFRPYDAKQVITKMDLPDKNCFEYQTYHEGENKILKISVEKCTFPPSIEYSDICFSKVIDALLENSGITIIILTQLREYEYDYSQTKLLVELASLYKKLNKDERYAYSSLVTDPLHERYVRGSYAQFQRLITKRLKEDPFAAYVELKRLERAEKVKLEVIIEPRQITSQQKFMRVMTEVIMKIEQLPLIAMLMPHARDYQLNHREIYSNIFHPTTRPDFMYTKLVSEFPDGNLAESYNFGDRESDQDQCEVNIFTFDKDIKILYHLTPPEFKFDEEVYELLDDAKRIMSEHKPSREEFVDPQRMREVFFNIGKDLLSDLAEHKKMKLSEETVNQLARALLRYTVGFGLIELLLADPKVQDVNVNSPNGQLPVFIVHQDYGDCCTNIYPTRLEVDSWATKLRLISGRPLDEANPILDTELKVTGFSSRVAALTAPLSPTGLAFSFRRHRDYPWTFPLYLQPKIRMMNFLAAGLLSFLIDNNATILIAGTRSSGKSSLLGSVLVELMRKTRIITLEDSVTGDGEILVKINNKITKTKIGKLIDDRLNEKDKTATGHETAYNKEKFQVYSVNDQGKICWSKVNRFVRHEVKKDIYEIITRTGRIIKVTQDHSLFTLHNYELEPVEASKLSLNDFVAVPCCLSNNNKDIPKISLTDYLSSNQILRKGYVFDQNLISKLKVIRKRIYSLGKKKGYTKATLNRWIRLGIIPVEMLLELKISPHNSGQFRASKNSRGIPLELKLDKDFLSFLGLWAADGCYDTNSIIMAVGSIEEKDLVKKIAQRFKVETKIHSDNFSSMLNSTSLRAVMGEVLELKGDAYTKRVPSWVFNLSAEQIGWFLKGLFSGDGHAGKQEVILALASRGLLEDVQTLLLHFGIIFRIGAMNKDKTYPGRISCLESLNHFENSINFIQKEKQNRLNLLCSKISTHDSTNIIPLQKDVRKELHDLNLKYHYYLSDGNNIGKNKLRQILKANPAWLKNNLLRKKLELLAFSDIFWDKIRKIKKLPPQKIKVYDLSVPETEKFIVNNIIAHNTFELPQESLRALGYNLESLKVASALSAPGSEVDASIGIRSTLRLGDSAIFVGEVRSKEAVALFEAMRVGAAANVVAGTIHADSPYGVYDRVVNDIGVPKTSFKAIDIIVTVNPVISGLKKYKRILRITEVRKEWDDDPLKEGAFVDLMVYNPKTDELELTDDLINGNSDIIKRMAGKVKEFAGNWDAVWENVQLRADCKKAIVDLFNESEDSSLLEADFVVRANDMFHLIADRVKDKSGKMDSKRILFEYKAWLRKEAKKGKSVGED